MLIPIYHVIDTAGDWNHNTNVLSANLILAGTITENYSGISKTLLMSGNILQLAIYVPLSHLRPKESQCIISHIALDQEC